MPCLTTELQTDLDKICDLYVNRYKCVFSMNYGINLFYCFSDSADATADLGTSPVRDQVCCEELIAQVTKVDSVFIVYLFKFDIVLCIYKVTVCKLSCAIYVSMSCMPMCYQADNAALKMLCNGWGDGSYEHGWSLGDDAADSALLPVDLLTDQ
jgi:hypothetical protein